MTASEYAYETRKKAKKAGKQRAKYSENKKDADIHNLLYS